MSRRTDEKEKQMIEPGDVGRLEDALGAGDPLLTPSEPTGGTPPAADPGPSLFKIERVPEARRMTGVTVQSSPRTTVQRFPLDEESWHVDRPTAQAAVRTGAFRIADDSQAKLKE